MADGREPLRTTAYLPAYEPRLLIGPEMDPIGRHRPSLSSETKCNTPADLIIGTADQDLRECCHAMLFAFVGSGKRTDRLAKALGHSIGGDRPIDWPSEIDGFARALPQQAAERALLAASRRRSLSIAQAA